jgi:hypothetical protein
MDIVKLYRAIMQSLNLVIDHEGLVSLEVGGETFPAVVGNKRLVLPTPEVLRAGNWNGHIAFHPMSENAMRTESVVLKKLRDYINLRLSHVLAILLDTFTEISSNTAAHAKLSPKLSEMLSAMPDADEKTYQTLEKIFDAIRIDGKNKLISVYLKRGGKIGPDKYARVAVVAFPFMDEFDGENGTVFGIKCRKKDFEGFAKLFKYIMPGADKIETYSYGSNSLYAPYFDALIHAYANVAAQLNVRVKAFHKHLPDVETLQIDLDWVEDIEDIGRYRDLIPSLSGNDGDPMAGETAAAPAPVHQAYNGPTAPAPAPVPVAEQSHNPTGFRSIDTSVYQHPIPTPTTEPARPSGTGGVKWGDVVAHNRGAPQQPQPQYPVQQTQYPNPGYGSPAPQQQQPQIVLNQYNQPCYLGPRGEMIPIPQQPQQQQQVPVDQWGRPVMFDSYGNPVMMPPPPGQPMNGQITYNVGNPQQMMNVPDWARDAVPINAPQQGRQPSFGMPQQPQYNPRQASFGAYPQPQQYVQYPQQNVQQPAQWPHNMGAVPFTRY